MTTEAPRQWNVMIYLAGENNLAEECVWALKEIKRAKPDTSKGSDLDYQVRVVAQLDAGGLGGKEARYILKHESERSILERDRITEKDTSETSYRSVLKDFVASSLTLNPRAQKYCLILSGHGNGIISDFLSKEVETPDSLSIPKLQWVLSEAKEEMIKELGHDFDEFKIDVLGLDSCMMSMAEIGYELRNYAKYMVGAEGFEPNAGWPYERIMSSLLSNPEMTNKDFAENIVDQYVKYYSEFLPAGRSVDQAVCDLSECEDLAEAVKSLADVLTKALSKVESVRQIILAHWEAQSYKDDQYVDLYDFCDLLTRGPEPKEAETGSVVMKGTTVDQPIIDACNKVKSVIRDQQFVISSRHSGAAVQFSYGVSIYFPWAHVIDSYSELEFAQNTGWHKFLEKYVEKTRRHKRPCLSNPNAKTENVKLFFNPGSSGFDFILTNNKDMPQLNRMMGNKVGTMKNPALEFVPCEQDEQPTGSTDKDQSGHNPGWSKNEPESASG